MLPRTLALPAAVMAIAIGQTGVAPKAAQPRWEMKYMFDEDDSELVILDLKFPSAMRGIASGTVNTGRRGKNVVLLTSDGGNKWELVPVKEPGYSLFFLNESVGWMVTPKGVWKTVESGRSWKKQASPKLTRRVYFLDENHGYALCGMKSVFETADGGSAWKLLSVSQRPTANPDFAAYDAIDFTGVRGLITGWSSPPRRESRLPDWMQPEQATVRREWPSMSFVLETADGGKSWKADTASMFGRIAKVDLAADGHGLALFEYRHAFEVPSEIVYIDLKTGKSVPVYKKRDRKITDLLLFEGGVSYLAGIEAPPELHDSPVPGRLKVLRSSNFSLWQEVEVDYRASGTRAILAASDPQNVWVATDNGAILKLTGLADR